MLFNFPMRAYVFARDAYFSKKEESVLISLIGVISPRFK